MHIPQACAQLLNSYHRTYLNPYVNFHRPCFFPVDVIDHKGKIKKKYPYDKINTPYEKMKALPHIENYLRLGVTLERLQAYADQMSDNQFAERMVKARSNLFKQSQRLTFFDRN